MKQCAPWFASESLVATAVFCKTVVHLYFNVVVEDAGIPTSLLICKYVKERCIRFSNKYH